MVGFNMSKHTLGPWHQDSDGYIWSPESQDYEVAIVMKNADRDLIAAAPEMLAALKALIEPCRTRATDDSHIDLIESVIAKAERK